MTSNRTAVIFVLLSVAAISLWLWLVVGCDAVQSVATEENLEGAQQVLDVVAPLLPPPFNALAGLAGGLALGLVRAWLRKRQGLSVIKALESVKVGNSIDITNNAERISAAMGSAGKALVDEAQGKTRSLPF